MMSTQSMDSKNNTFGRLGPSITRRAFGLGAGAAAGIATFGHGLRPAQAATTINWMGWEEYGYPLRSGTFLDDNDIELGSTFASSIESILAKLRGGGVGTMNIGMPTWNYMPLFEESDVIQPIDVSRLPNYEQLYPFWQEFDGLHYKGEQFAVPYLWGGLPMIYRPDMVEEPPTSWMDMLRPEYKNKVCTIHDTTSSMWHWVYTVTGVDQASMITPTQLKETVDFMIKVKKEHARFHAMSYGEALDALVRGEVAIAGQGWEPMVTWAAEKGVTLDYVYPKEKSYGWMDVIVIAKDAPHLDETYALINHALGVEAQTEVGNTLILGAVNEQAYPNLTPEMQGLYSYNDVLSFYNEKAPLIPLPPFEDDGTHATYNQWLEEYERFLKA